MKNLANMSSLSIQDWLWNFPFQVWPHHRSIGNKMANLIFNRFETAFFVFFAVGSLKVVKNFDYKAAMCKWDAGRNAGYRYDFDANDKALS